MRRLLFFLVGSASCSLFLREVDPPAPKCGNDVIDLTPDGIPTEECDDGDAEPGDGCDADCKPETGFNCIGSPSVCTATCGDGVIAAGVEECDDGKNNSNDAPNACRLDCTLFRCGDGVIDFVDANQNNTPDEGEGEVCDDGANNSDTAPGACRTTCVEAACGDGVFDPDQFCFRAAGSFSLGGADLLLDLTPLGLPITLPGTFTSADINNDGNLDFVVTAPGSNQVVSVLGNGDGTFDALFPPLPVSGNPVGIASADFNGDGNIDIAVTRVLVNFILVVVPLGELDIFLGNGDGTFTFSQNLNGLVNPGVNPLVIVKTDLEGDGDDDLISANLSFQADAITIQNTDNLRILVNSNGTFGNANLQTFSFGKNADVLDIASGDIDNDGKIDLITANSTSADIGVFLQSDFGGFDAPQFIPQAQGAGTIGLELGDFNSDGLLDIAAANTGLSTVTISAQQGDGSFLQISETPTNSPIGTIRQLLSSDLDQDGNLDLIVSVANLNSSVEDVGILPGNGDGTFDSILFLKASEGAFDIIMDDFDNDTNLDIAVINLITSDISVLVANP